MKKPIYLERFLQTTRGKILLMLREGACTVSDLAEELELTENGVRQHLVIMERDGLVIQSGERPGVRKPHLLYRATEEADELFPAVYDEMLNLVLSAVAESCDKEVREKIVAEAGQRLSKVVKTPPKEASQIDRIDFAKRLVNRLGGKLIVSEDAGKLRLRGAGICPLHKVTQNHDSACHMMARALTEIFGHPVEVCCQQDKAGPHCCFEVAAEKS